MDGLWGRGIRVEDDVKRRAVGSIKSKRMGFNNGWMESS